MEDKMTLPKWLERMFCKHLYEEIDRESKRANKYGRIAFYWEAVARGETPMPDEGANIQWLANNFYYTIFMKHSAQRQLASMENAFRISGIYIEGE